MSAAFAYNVGLASPAAPVYAFHQQQHQQSQLQLQQQHQQQHTVQQNMGIAAASAIHGHSLQDMGYMHSDYPFAPPFFMDSCLPYEPIITPYPRPQTLSQQHQQHYPPRKSLSFSSTSTSTVATSPHSRPSTPPSPPDVPRRPQYAKWSPEEDVLLRAAVAKHGTSKWSMVAASVPGRTPMQCSTRWQGALNTSIHKGRWGADEDAILIDAVEKWSQYARANPHDEATASIPWSNIAALLPRSRTGIQCQARWSEALDPSVRKGKWTKEEDEMLMLGVQKFGRCWIKIAAGVEGRTQRQCRTRWMQIKSREKKQAQSLSNNSQDDEE